MNFNDIFKSSFLENVSAISMLDMALALVLSICLGMLIFLVYQKCCSGVMYSQSFGITLVALTMVTSLVIMAVTSNVVLSLGMVGALSIVRFRTAIKEPLDIAFLFWAIADGIVLAAGLIPLAVIGSAMIALILLTLANRKSRSCPYMLVLGCSDHSAEQRALQYLAGEVSRWQLKGKTVQPGSVELDVELYLKDDDTDFVNALALLPGVASAVLVSYNGDYMG